jgi:cytochrome b561
MRRLAALAGILVLVVLALTLLWRVYLHHTRVNPDENGLTELATRAGFVAARAPEVSVQLSHKRAGAVRDVKFSHTNR